MATADVTSAAFGQAAAAGADYIASLPGLTPLSARKAKVADGGVGDPMPQQSGVASSTVVGGSQLAFTANLDATHKTDLLYLLGFVQLQVLQNGDPSLPNSTGIVPQDDPVGYFNACVNMIQDIGFSIETLNWANYDARAQTFELDLVEIEIVSELITGPQLALAGTALSALKSASETGDPAWTIYSDNSSSDSAGGFALGVADQTTSPVDGSVSVTLQLATFAFSGATNHTKFLWMTYNPAQFDLQDANTICVFNDALWNTPGVGDAISAAMSTCAANYICNLPPLTV